MSRSRTPGLAEHEVRQLRLQAQLLTTGTRRTLAVEDVVRATGGLQAQEEFSARLAVRARSMSLTASDVDQALEDDRSVVRIWAMRGTLHMVPAEDVGWLLPLLGPYLINASRRRFRDLGLEERTTQRALGIIRQSLTSAGPLTRQEIAERLRSGGVDPEGQRTIHLIRRAALEGVLCQGPRRGGEPAFVLLDDWLAVDLTSPGDASLTEMASRYLAAYGPATPGDFAAWSGLPMPIARRAWGLLSDSRGKRLLSASVGGEGALVLDRQLRLLRETPQGTRESRPPELRLLPRYDTYLLGYASRQFSVPPEFATKVHRGAVSFAPACSYRGSSEVPGSW